jgi:POT family proton-dependent oligopeptide transporter
VLFFTELWERFAYYGMRALLILYLIDKATGGLGWSQERASRLYGWFIGLTYLTPVAGGWLADRFLGTNRSLLVGGTVLAFGHLSLAFGTAESFYAGLALVVIGTGFFKPNVHTMVGQLFQPDDPRRDSGFTLYYMGINLGAFLGPLVCAWLAVKYGWSYGFAAASAGMAIGVAFYLWARGRWLQNVGLPPRPGSASPQLRSSVALTAVERQRIAAIGIITLFVVVFWLAFEQAGSSLNVFAATRTDRTVGAWTGWLAPNGEIPAAWFQSINPFFVMLLAPAVAALWQRLGYRAPSTPGKMALGLILFGLAYTVMATGAAQSAAGSPVSPWLLVLFYLIYTLGELCFLPVGISFVSQTAPARMASMLMGIWLTANFVASLIGGYLAGMVPRIERGEIFHLLGGQADFFLIFMVLCLAAGLMLALLVPLIKRLTGAPTFVGAPRAWTPRPRPLPRPPDRGPEAE